MDRNKEILLVLRAQSGDKEAYNLLLKSVQKPLYWYILNLLNDKSLAEDILQDIFILIYRKLPILRQPEFFRAWIYKIATRETFHVIKKRNLYNQMAVDCDDVDSYALSEGDDSLDEQILNKLHLLIESLSPASRSVISLHYLGQMTINEVSMELNISVNTVKSRLSYGLKILKKKIESDKLMMDEGGLNDIGRKI